MMQTANTKSDAVGFWYVVPTRPRGLCAICGLGFESGDYWGHRPKDEEGGAEFAHARCLKPLTEKQRGET